MSEKTHQARAVAVDRLQRGDHGCLGYADDEARWEILGVFARNGFALGEKVLFFMEGDTSADEVGARISPADTSARAGVSP